MEDTVTSADVWKNFTKTAITTGISNVTNSNASVTTDGMDIIVSGVDSNVTVYNISGMKIYQGSKSRIPVNTPGIYVVTFDNTYVKIAVR
jgi:hypothetical protein